MMRLGIMWPGVEPSEANYNQTYLVGMQELVGAAGVRGIVSLLDFHVRLIVLYNLYFFPRCQHIRDRR
jgi:hypothetical protein